MAIPVPIIATLVIMEHDKDTAANGTAPKCPTIMVSTICTMDCPANDSMTGSAIVKFFV